MRVRREHECDEKHGNEKGRKNETVHQKHKKDGGTEDKNENYDVYEKENDKEDTY